MNLPYMGHCVNKPMCQKDMEGKKVLTILVNE